MQTIRRLPLRLPLLGLAAGAALLGFSAGAQAQTPLKFVLDWAFTGSQAPWVLAADNGCFTREGLAVTIDRGFGSGDSVTKVATGAYDMGFADINSMIQFNAKNPQSKALGVFIAYDASPLAILALKPTSIAKPADLKSKTLAAPPGDASRVLFPVLAKAQGIDIASINWMNVAPELREQMLLQKKADAITGHIMTSLFNLRAAGIKDEQVEIFRFPQWGADLLGSALLARPAYAEANPKAVTSFIKCTVEAFNISWKDPKIAIAALKKRDPLVDEKVETDRLQMSLDLVMLTDNVKANGYSSISPERLKKSIDQVSAAFEIPAAAPEDVYTPKYLPPKDTLVAKKM